VTVLQTEFAKASQKTRRRAGSVQEEEEERVESKISRVMEEEPKLGS